MNILWIVNTVFPAPSSVLNLPSPVVGGWMYGLAGQLSALPNIRLAVATVYSGTQVKALDLNGVLYYLLPVKSNTAYQRILEGTWKQIIDEFKPDLIHIHGTELPHGLACIQSCPQLNYILSIQGLISVISKYYLAGMTSKEILSSITFRDIIRRDTIFQSKRKFVQRGEYEKEYIQRAKHVIGRTSWDYAHIKTLNPAISYHFCNESLRSGFYSASKWDLLQKTKYQIFLSQAGYPVKGAHQVLKAAELLKNDFPGIRVRVAGYNIVNNDTLSKKMKLSGYGNYLLQLIRSLGLQDHVRFLGSLDEDQIIAEYQKAHTFICPSSIENSPNSVGEAQILGVPVIASFVGGIPDMVEHGKTGTLYRFEEVEMLAQYIRNLFVDDSLASTYSFNSIKAAELRHNRENNLNQLLNIYKIVSDQ